MPHDDDGRFYTLDEWGEPNYYEPPERGGEEEEEEPDDDETPFGAARAHDDGRETEAADENLRSATGVRAAALAVVALARRPYRRMSIEQEVGAGGQWIAREFFRAGLTSHDAMGSYHSRNRAGGFAIVEDDSSCGGEVIYPFLHLDRPAGRIRFAQALDIIRRGIRAEQVRLTTAAGLHIHVDLAGFSIQQVASLYRLWNYLEDPIFRIASAHWSGHRGGSDGGYARLVPKHLLRHVDIARGMRGDRYALNLSPYLSAIRNCSCGAFEFGAWQECSCGSGLDKATVEFRVFNASANPRKIRAYAALAQALVAKAERDEHPADLYPEFAYNYRRSIAAEYGADSATMERLRFIFRELPLAQCERDDILYCVTHSSLSGIGEAAISELATIGRRSNRASAQEATV